MVVPHAILPDLNTLDADSLRALLVETHERYCTTAQRLQSRESEIAHLKRKRPEYTALTSCMMHFN
jgi:hypothetical protein